MVTKEKLQEFMEKTKELIRDDQVAAINAALKESMTDDSIVTGYDISREFLHKDELIDGYPIKVVIKTSVRKLSKKEIVAIVKRQKKEKAKAGKVGK